MNEIIFIDEAPPETVPPLEALLPLPPHLLEQQIEKAVQECRDPSFSNRIPLENLD